MAWTTSYLLSQRSTETYIRPPQTVFRPHFAIRPSGGAIALSPEKAFGDEVIAHYANAARVEIAAFDSAVTDWEKARNFERI